jgi:N-acylglucosamine 2-epimerase
MIRVATYQILREADPGRAAAYTALIDRSIDEIFALFLKPDRRALLETVGPAGEMLDGPAGRCVNPGHAIETCWFLMTEARLRHDRGLLERALPILDWSLALGWDPVHGGLFSFVDVEGRQPEQVEWDMKYWWPHTEAIYATLLAYALTGKGEYAAWFEKVLDWSLAHFPDLENGEWFGYLHRDGSVALDLKGNNWKGPFHLPRAQLYAHLLLEEMIAHGVPLRL